ncbi:MAG: ribosome-associated translation inhibitor RaiA [Rhodospirillaceae bacterium]|nr:ribosome-associated translation inhibitor RaiA [Rhodospirillaceae bacterium]
MQTPVQVVFHGMDHSDAVEANIAKEIEKLEKIYGRITNCRVTVESPHRSHRKGSRFDVGIHLALPGSSMDVRAGNNPKHSDIHIAVSDAFGSLARKLKEHHDRQNDHRG